MSDFQVINGDSLDVLKQLQPNVIDSMITDPPAGIGFMGKEWDSDKGGRVGWISWLQSIMTEALRVLKPGAHALVWAIPRTSHWTATALEQAGFEIRDVVTHHFGTGFPKSLNIVKAGAGEQWEGWGTALKPATEHWILARKPLAGTVAGNVLEHGTGGINVDACRIEGEDSPARWTAPKGMGYSADGAPGGTYDPSAQLVASGQGRWPANLLLSHSADCVTADSVEAQEGASVGCVDGCPVATLETQNEGASRFFYVTKPSTAERDEGLAHLPKKTGSEILNRKEGSAGIENPRAGAGRGGNRANHHPTVKSLALMTYLVKMISPPGGVVLDPFTGSGSTGCAAVLGGWSFLGIEKDIEFHRIAEERIKYWATKRPG